MIGPKKMKLLMLLVFLLGVISSAFADNSYDRELIVTGDNTRSAQVEVVFKNLMAAYEDEDAQGFLDLVSDERFRQDYITFTDALYSDFRSYEIHHVDYWIDRVVPDHVKRFLYVRWEKRYESLDDGRQLTTRGFSRFLFDDVDGDYLLVELAGNSLFGASLPEWVEEVPQISGQELRVDDVNIPDVVMSPVDVCDSDHLYLCDGADCSSNGGYWYDGSCHNDPQGQPDLEVLSANWVSGSLSFTVINGGDGPSGPCHLEAEPITVAPMAYVYPIPALSAGQTYSTTVSGVPEIMCLSVDSNNVVDEIKENNNQSCYPF